MTDTVTRDWCEHHADRYGVSAPTLEENLIGADVGEAETVLRLMDHEERVMRSEYGVKYTFKHFSPRRTLRGICRDRGLGGWTKETRDV